MGAGASTAETSDFVREQGNAYAPYADSIVDNGVDGALVADIMAGEGADVEDALADLGITNKLHIRKIMLGARAQVPSPTGTAPDSWRPPRFSLGLTIAHLGPDGV